LGLGDPADIGPGKPGGFLTEDHRQMALNRRRGQPPDVSVPTEVRFDYGEKKRKEMFCFAVTAAGWHMGALAIDLEVSRIWCVRSMMISVQCFRQQRMMTQETRQTLMMMNHVCLVIWAVRHRNHIQHHLVSYLHLGGERGSFELVLQAGE
jgi:hypothetical protein